MSTTRSLSRSRKNIANSMTKMLPIMPRRLATTPPTRGPTKAATDCAPCLMSCVGSSGRDTGIRCRRLSQTICTRSGVAWAGRVWANSTICGSSPASIETREATGPTIRTAAASVVTSAARELPMLAESRLCSGFRVRAKMAAHASDARKGAITRYAR